MTRIDTAAIHPHSKWAWLVPMAAIAALVLTPEIGDAEIAKLEDHEVARAIDNQYFHDPAIDANRINVRVTDGIAELTGTVRDILAKERAAEIAGLVKGVRVVSNRIVVEPSATRSEAEIRTDVQAALLRDPATDSYEVEVAVKENVVTLTGTVDSWAEKQLSAKVAKGVAGVVEVKNDIRVAPQPDRPDPEIRAEVERRLHWDVLVDGYLIDVAVEQGHVALTGSVGSVAEKRQAEADAWKAGGVSAVDVAGLHVQWWAEDEDLRNQKYVKREDSQIETAIEEAAFYDPRVSSFKIDPDASNGWITLRGTVDNLEAKNAAEQLARNTVGVTGVTNQLKVRLASPPSDEEIQSQVQGALVVNPVTDRYEIEVYVNDGWVTLRGTVDSQFEKIEAEREAARVTGVVAVQNRLAVADRVSYVLPFYHYPWAFHPTPIVVTPLPSSASDYTIRERIESEFVWSPFVDADQVDLRVESGVVTLKGTVDSWREFHAAADNAYEGGAVSVVNRLVVAN